MRAPVRTATFTFVAGLAVAALMVPAYAAPSETPSPEPTTATTPSTTPDASITPSTSATSAKPSATVTLPPLTKFEGPKLTLQDCDVRVDYALDPAVRIETWRKVNDGAFERQFHPNWYWTDTDYEPGDKVTWQLRYNGETKEGSITVPDPCDGEPAPIATPTPTPTPTAAPRGVVTAKYECGSVTFTNPLDKSVLIHYGTAQTDDLEGSIHIEAGKSQTVESTNKAFGWTAWAEGDQTQDDVGHLWLPGEDLSCDEPDDSATPKPHRNGLADTGR